MRSYRAGAVGVLIAACLVASCGGSVGQMGDAGSVVHGQVRGAFVPTGGIVGM